MFGEIDIKNQLTKLSEKTRNGGDLLVADAKRILKNDLFTGDKVLVHLAQYNGAVDFADEEDIDPAQVFTLAEIKEICIYYRLKFLDPRSARQTVPYGAVLAVKSLESQFGKDFKDIRVLAPLESFTKKDISGCGLLFVKTNYDNYYLVHKWGKNLQWYRKLRYWPMRYFENLFSTIIVTTLLITLCLPTGLITLDPKAVYWSGYRAAAFFHLLIFNTGVTAYVTFTFAKNFSSSVWNRDQDFD